MKKLPVWCARAFALAASLWLPGQALAGASFGSEVYVGPDSARGQMGSAYHSADDTQRIGCYVNAYMSGTTPQHMVFCQARDAANNSLYCSAHGVEAAHFASALATASSESYLFFRVNDQGRCSTVLVQTQSSNPPK